MAPKKSERRTPKVQCHVACITHRMREPYNCTFPCQRNDYLSTSLMSSLFLCKLLILIDSTQSASDVSGCIWDPSTSKWSHSLSNAKNINQPPQLGHHIHQNYWIYYIYLLFTLLHPSYLFLYISLYIYIYICTTVFICLYICVV